MRYRFHVRAQRRTNRVVMGDERYCCKDVSDVYDARSCHFYYFLNAYKLVTAKDDKEKDMECDDYVFMSGICYPCAFISSTFLPHN